MSKVDPFNAVDDSFVASSDSYQDTAYYPEQPEERTEAESKDAAILAASYPIMAGVADWFDEQVSTLDSRSAVLQYAKAYDIDVELAGRAFDVARDILEAKASEFADYRSEK